MATLTKSRYLYGLQCLKRLWIDEHARERLAPASPGEHMIMEQGIEVGKKAREYFRGGILVDIQDFDSADRQTQQLIQDGAACIFEAAFILDDLRVRCDVIQKHTDNTWKIVEVKSSLKVKEEHLPDLAFQHHVLSKLGVPVAGLEILHINSECIYPDLSDLFRSEDVTSQVVALQEKTARDVDIFINTLNRDAEPEVLIGRHCIKPDVCPAKEPCWAGVPVQSVFTIPYISEDKTNELVASNCISINELPADYPLSGKQRAYVEGVLTGEAKIDRKAMGEILSGYDYPIHFLDFETLNPAIPRFDGMNPFEKFPFQYSLHVWRENGTVEHFEYLHMEKTDPRSPLLESLYNRVAEHGSVVVYHAPFERGVLARMAEYAPHSAPSLKSIINRLNDQKDIFKNHYNHPGFLGSLSLKSVLPVIAPSLNYEGLNIRGGSDAGAVWERMINSTDEAQKSQMAADLKAYCAMDTLAMVEIHRALLKL